MSRNLQISLYCILLAAALLALPARETFAQGGYAGVIHRMGIASRSEAMGRAYTAVVGNTESAFYNPATVTAMQQREVNLSFRALSLDRTFTYIGFATAIRPRAKSGAQQPLNGGLALSWIHAAVSDIDGRDFDGEKFATFSNNQNSVRLAFALQVHPAVSIGLGGHVTWNQFPRLGRKDETVGASAAGLDFGVLFSGIEGVRIGVVYKNINAKFTWNSDKIYERGSSKVDDFPKIFRFGIATTRLYKNLLVSFDFEDSEQQESKLYFGGEYTLLPGVVLRTGLRDGNFSAGGAYTFDFIGKRSSLHYAFVDQPTSLDSEHVFSWSFAF